MISNEQPTNSENIENTGPDKTSHNCKSCCRPKTCSLSADPTKPKNSSSPSEESHDIIRSPLDLRTYKSLVLPNGLRVMLISTYDIVSDPEEVDATKTPCQVPEIAEFNKSYLGYDNPAARVRCACPCDESKPCCGKGKNKKNDTKTRKSIIKEYENIKAACCSKKTASSCEEKKVSFDGSALKDFRHEAIHHRKTEDLDAYRNAIFNELQSRTQIKSRPRSNLGNSCNCRENVNEEVSTKMRTVDDKVKSQQNKSVTDSNIFRDICKLESDEVDNNLNSMSPTPVPSDEDFLRHKVSSRHNYPYPPTQSEGLHSIHPCPIDSIRGRTRRPQFSSQFNPDFDGTAYLVIGSGYFDDPDDQPGLAHFCEHAVFLGSNKFPEPNQLFKLVLPYDGYVNAYTSGMMTTFTTSTNFRLFPLAVEILADMVGFPLFPNTLVAAELEALDSEYSLRQDDTPKYFQLIGSLAREGHVMRKMDSGNISTLMVPNFYRKLVEWKRIYYNPSRMTVALEAPFPIDYMERLVVECFGVIPPSAPLPLMINPHLMFNSPFEMNRFHQIYHVPSVYHSEFIALHWALDGRAWKNLKTKPLEYLGAIIAHKAEGGLCHYLTTQGLATNVEAGCWESDVTRNHYTSVFCISVDMTEKGFKRQDNILQAIFGYIQLLINSSPQKSFFQELQKQQLDSFHYKAAESSFSIADNVSRWMQYIPPKWCMISPSLTVDFDEKLIQKYTESLTVETTNVIIFSKNYRGTEYMSSVEEFYNTPYTAYNFPEELEEKMRKTKDDYAAKFSLPHANPLLLETTCNRAQSKDLLQKGVLLKKKGKLTISYISRKVKIVRGLLPQARYSLWFGSPSSSYVGAPEGSSTKMIIWSRLFNDIIENKFYHASNADIQLETEVAHGELHMTIAGPYTMLPPLVEQVVALLKNFENIVDQVSFEVARSTFIESLDNTILDNRFLAWDLFYYLWTNNHDLIFDHKRNAERLSFPNFLNFVKSFKLRMYIQAHLYGYVTKSQGDMVVNAIKNLDYAPIELRQYMLFRCLRLPLGERIIRVNSQNPNIHTSVVINSYQFGMLTEAQEDVVTFFAKSMSDAAFYQLRTEQQLGYIIIIYAEMTFGVSSIVIELVTQPKNFTTEYCNSCIDDFLQNFYFSNLHSEDQFRKFSMGKPKLSLSFETVQNLFKNHLLENSVTYRKISIQVVGALQNAPNLGSKNPEKDPGTTQVMYPNSNKVPLDESANSKIYRTQSLGGRTTIGQVRAAKKSMQYHGDSVCSTKCSITGSKIITDIAKFKSNLIQYPKSW